MLSSNHFVPASDEGESKPQRSATRSANVKVTIDTIAGLQLPSKLTSEVQTQRGMTSSLCHGVKPTSTKNKWLTLTTWLRNLGKGRGVV